MITLYRTADDPTGQEVQETLEALCFAHKVVLVTDSGPMRENLPEGTNPPVVVDEGTTYQGRAAVLERLRELKAIHELWYKVGSDACYCDEQGNVE